MKSKTTLIELSGGFHNTRPLRMRVKEISIHPGVNTLSEILSEAQYLRASNHFCGIRGCTCGGVARAMWVVLTPKGSK